MTATLLLATITTAILLQVIGGVVIALWRLPIATNLALSPSVIQATSYAAWPGWRDFRVVRRSFEDPAQTQCSFFLTPDDGAAPPAFAPGQYITIATDQSAQISAAPNGPVRCYSLSDVPNAPSYRITVKRSLAPLDRLWRDNLDESCATIRMKIGSCSNWMIVAARQLGKGFNSVGRRVG